MTTAALLERAMSIIERPSTFAQGALALDSKNREVRLNHETAKRFDMIGALHRAGGTPNEYGEAIMHLRRACGDRSIFEFNDTHGHKAVKTAMRRAIEAARKT